MAHQVLTERNHNQMAPSAELCTLDVLYTDLYGQLDRLLRDMTNQHEQKSLKMLKMLKNWKIDRKKWNNLNGLGNHILFLDSKYFVFGFEICQLCFFIDFSSNFFHRFFLPIVCSYPKQCAALKIHFSLIKEPPQTWEPNPSSSAICHGFCSIVVTNPPTIL